MKALVSITLIIMAYLLLRFGNGQIESWLGALIATFLVIGALLIWLFGFSESNYRFRPFRKFGWLEGTFLTVAASVVLAIMFGLFWVGPILAEEIRAKTVPAGFGPGTGGNGQDPNKRGSQQGEKIVSGNSESPEIQIPDRGGPQFMSFPEVRIEPLDEASSSFLKTSRSYVSLKYLDKFDGRARWSVSSPHRRTWIADDLGKIELTQPGFGYPISYNVSHAPDYRLLHSLQGLASVELKKLISFGEGYRLPPVEGEPKLSRSYDCVSYPLRFRDLPNSEKNRLQVAEANSQYLDRTLTPLFKAKLEKWTDALKKFPTTAQRIEGVKTILRQNCRYSLDVINPRNLPPIENFMFDEQVGYCLHFASAGVLLCRELGIPARLVSGYAGGTHFSRRDMWVFYTDNAHSWVEIKLKGLGWVVLETTPPEGVSSNETPTDRPPAPFQTEQQREEAYRQEQLIDTDELAGAVYSEARGILFVIAILFAVLLGIGVWQKRENKKRRRSKKEEQDERLRFEERLYLAIYRKVSRLIGFPMMDGDTLQAHISWLKDKNAVPSFADELLRYHYDTAYREQDKDGTVEARLIKQIKAWK